jgi:UDP-N-acetylglucosamine acyltransferase
VTSVGNNGYFMAYSHIGHDCVVEDDVNFANNATLAGHVQIGQGVIIGGLSAVQQFGRVGRGAMIGGVTGVNTDVIPYGMAIGDHAVLGGLNIIGLKRRGVSREAIHAIRTAFRAIFLETTGTLVDRARKAKAAWPEVAQVQEIVDFILADAKRGLCVADPSRRHMDAE